MSTTETGSDDAQTSSDARLALVEEHVRKENDHDLDGIMATFGTNAWWADESRSERHEGRDSVRAHYHELLQALPDYHIGIDRRHVTDTHVILEVTITGTHTGTWNGLPGTGNELEFPACAVFAFDDEGKIAGERLYYDRASVLRQLGIFREPDEGLGRLLTPLAHPVTITRAVVRSIQQE